MPRPRSFIKLENFVGFLEFFHILTKEEALEIQSKLQIHGQSNIQGEK